MSNTIAPTQLLVLSNLGALIRTGFGWLQTLAMIAAPLALRIGLAVPFYSSGLTKWTGFLTLTPAAQFLFEEQFKLHVFGRQYDLPAPALLAWFDGVAEIVLPIFLVVGFATRLSALGLLGMTAVIQLVVPDGWANFHLPWAAMAIALIALGPGPLSFDRVVGWVFASWSSVDQSRAD